VPPEYDNLLAKVMVHAADRGAAIDRLARALAETEIAGIQTTLPFHRFVAGHAGFRAADLSIGWVAEHWDGAAAAARAEPLARLAAALAWPERSSVARGPDIVGSRAPTGTGAATGVHRASGARDVATGAVHARTGMDRAAPAPGGWSSAALESGVDRWPA
jgi:acetyl/propionyl-CoA carboxylase alpha subunit